MKRKNHVLLFTILTGIILWLTMVVHIPLDTQSGDMPPAPTRVGKNFRVEHLTPEEGLPSLTVWSIVQDQQGFMWFATNNGLSRYDGYTFKTFHNDPRVPHSISIESFGTLYVDRQGVLWVGTWNGGLNVFDRTTEQFTRYLHDPDDPYSLSHNRVNVIFEDKSGRLWLGTDGGLDRFDRTSGQFLHYQHDPKDPHSLSSDVVKTIIEDASGQLWVGTLGRGLNKFEPASGQFTRYQHDPQNPNSLIYDNIEAMAIETTGSLWIGTMAGLDYFDPATGKFTHYRHDLADPQSLSSDDIAALYLNASGDMWIATSGGGLNLFDPQTKTFTHVPSDSSDPYSFHGEWLSSIYADQSGALWIATTSGGVNRLDRAAAKFELYQHDPDDPDSLSPRSIWSILRDHSGTLWVASVGGGLNKLDPVTGHFQHYRHNPADPHSLSNDSIFAMAEDATGTLWIGTKEGLNRFDRTSEQFTRYTHDPTNPASLSENWVSGLYADRSGRLWVGTIGQGLDLFDPVTDGFRHYQADPANPHSLSGNNVVTFAEDPSGQLWIGTISGGLNKFDPETGTFIHYVHDPDNLNSLISDNVAHIYLDPAGVLWLATPAGLNKFDPQTETFTHYAEKEGLASKALASVVGDAQGNLWVGMQGSGLARFDPGSETFKNYDKSDGLQSNNFMLRGAYRDADGKLYFGGMNGLNAFYPDKLSDNPYIPPVVLTDFQIFNHSVPIGGEDSPLQQVINETDEIILSYQQSVFSFEFAALNYRAPEKNQYAYKLEGFEKDWNYVDSNRRFATYTNLDPGTYIFRVKASNNDGVWNEAGKAIRITITPPWWQTIWFRSLVAILTVGLVGGGYRWRVHTMKKRNQELETLITERTRELTESNEQLQIAKEQAEEAQQAAEAANQAKSTFLANMSHELRSPLNTILGFASLMRREALTGRQVLTLTQQGHLSLIHRSGEYLLTLINNVLDLSKIEAGRTSLCPTSFDLYRFLADIEDMFALRAEDKQLSLQVERSPDLPQYVRTDEVKLRQVLINLLSNALKFTEDGGVVVRVERIEDRRMEEDDLQSSIVNLQFSIADTGSGIAPEELNTLFEAFAQTTTGQSSREGTGLGLPISRQFVQLMGGDLSVQSNVGQGSVFQFDIPVEVIEATEIKPKPLAHRVIGLAPGQSRYRILIVDDNETNRQLLLNLLRPLGFDLREASNGQEGIDIWKEWEPHLIWMDMRMPVLNGYEATKRIKASPKGQQTRVLALTASSFEEERAMVLAAGCNDFLRKPFREADLLEMMSRHLGVCYVYEEAVKGQKEHIRAHFDVQDLTSKLAMLPDELLDKLETAAIRAKMNELNELLEAVRAHDVTVAEALTALANDFEYPRIVTLIQATKQHSTRE